MPDNTDDLKTRLKAVMVDELMLQKEASEIGDSEPLFGPDGLGLDSVDALQLAVALDKHFGLKITDAEAAKDIFQSVDTITEAVRSNASSDTTKE